jgi:23S rRNA (cytosine1962-C5)-methyltransferase
MIKDEKISMFANRLSKVFRHRSRLARKAGVSCFRIYDNDLPEFPFCIEIYEDNLYVAEYNRRHGMSDDSHARWLEESLDVMSGVLHIGREHIFLKKRIRKPGRQGQYKKQDESGHEFIVHENGLKFIVNLSDYLDTGLFLDHRITRQMVGRWAATATVRRC